MSLSRRTSILAVTAFAAAVQIAFVAAVWNARDRDITRLIVIGADNTDRTALPPGVTLVPGRGYDGTSFYRLALNPVTRQPTEFGITLDSPAYRHQRILYPVTAWILSAGRPRLIPWLLVAINVAALAALATLGASVAQSMGRSAAWGLIVSFYPGFAYSVTRDLSEPLACALGLGAIVALFKERHRTAAVLLCLAILTRETFLVLVLAIALVYVIAKWRDARPAMPPAVFLAPIATYVIWQVALTCWWGITPLLAGPRGISVPFAEYVRALHAASSLRMGNRLIFTELAYLGLCAGTFLVSLRRLTSGAFLAFAWTLQVLVVALGPHVMWEEDVGYMRILSDFYVIGAIITLRSQSRARWLLALATPITWYYVASHLIKYS